MLTTLQEKQGGVQAVHQLMAHPSFSVLHADCIPILVGDFHAFFFKCHFLVVSGDFPFIICQKKHFWWQTQSDQSVTNAAADRKPSSMGERSARPRHCA
jgi:hypothetical protein